MATANVIQDTENALADFPVFLSASVPEDTLNNPLWKQDLDQVLALLVGGIAAAGGTVIFGGHPNVTPRMHEVARRAGKGAWAIRLFQAEAFRAVAPEQVFDRQVFKDVQWFGDLPSMRDAMAAGAAAAVFVGGKTRNFYGPVPGIVDEYQRFRHAHPDSPVYLMGALGGQTRLLIDDLEKQGADERNTLTPAERRVVHGSGAIEPAVSLIVSDLIKRADAARGS